MSLTMTLIDHGPRWALFKGFTIGCGLSLAALFGLAIFAAWQDSAPPVWAMWIVILWAPFAMIAVWVLAAALWRETEVLTMINDDLERMLDKIKPADEA